MINIVLIVLLTALVTLLIRGMVRAKKAGKTTCSCGACPMAGRCHPGVKKE